MAVSDEYIGYATLTDEDRSFLSNSELSDNDVKVISTFFFKEMGDADNFIKWIISNPKFKLLDLFQVKLISNQSKIFSQISLEIPIHTQIFRNISDQINTQTIIDNYFSDDDDDNYKMINAPKILMLSLHYYTETKPLCNKEKSSSTESTFDTRYLPAKAWKKPNYKLSEKININIYDESDVCKQVESVEYELVSYLLHDNFHFTTVVKSIHEEDKYFLINDENVNDILPRGDVLNNESIAKFQTAALYNTPYVMLYRKVNSSSSSSSSIHVNI